jgi:hypothetical protein
VIAVLTAERPFLEELVVGEETTTVLALGVDSFKYVCKEHNNNNESSLLLLW